MGKLLRNLLKSPMFVIGVSIFVLTLLIAIFGPLFYNVDTHARDIVAGPYEIEIGRASCRERE